ncbi:phage major capsid protein [Kocuria sp. CPCC 205300]|uniref:phage major capsid protein n=1 Tax=Kocuria sabuli TaxID=3071448 RepID=UPI0036DBE7C8
MKTLKELLAEGKSLVEASKAGNLTNDQRERMKSIKADIEAAKAREADDASTADTLAFLKGAVVAPGKQERHGDGEVKSLGEHFIKHAGTRLKEIRGVSGASVAAPEFKAATDTHTVFQDLMDPLKLPGIQSLRPPQTIADLFSAGTLAGNTVQWWVEGLREGNFETVAEGGQKPQLHYAEPTMRSSALSKIAGFIIITDEMSEDEQFLVSEINNRLLYDLAVFEETQLLNGDGVGQNLTGLLNTSGLQTEAAADSTDNFDALFRATTKVQRGSGIAADAIVINPADYETLRLTQDANRQYIAGGPFTGQYGVGGVPEQPPLWGRRTVVTPAVAAGTAVVGAWKQGGTVYRKGGVRVESTNSHADNFTTNKITIRAEERLTLAVTRPSAFVRVALSAVAPV